MSQGKTVEEALENIKDAIQGCLEVLNERIVLKGREKVLEERKPSHEEIADEVFVGRVVYIYGKEQ